MPTEPTQIALAIFELSLFLAGVVLFFWVIANPAARARWLATNALPGPPMPVTDFALCTVLIFLTSFAFQGVVHLWLGGTIKAAADHEGLQLVVYNVAIYGGALVAWKFMFPSMRRSWALQSAPPFAAAPRVPLPWAEALRIGATCLLIALPVLAAVSFIWNLVIQQLHLPLMPQDVIAIFNNTKSPLVVAGMLLVACVLAPIYEELLFRAGLYRFCRQRLGRGLALLISGIGFGALHGNWASFLPLAVLGMGLAIAYEATGSIRVPIIAHSLFNLNTLLLLLSGLAQPPST